MAPFVYVMARLEFCSQLKLSFINIHHPLITHLYCLETAAMGMRDMIKILLLLLSLWLV